MKINTHILGLLTIVGFFLFQSCNDESYDVEGNPDNLIYFPPSKSHPDNMPNAVASFTVVSTPVGYLGDAVLAKFGVSATRPVSGTSTVTASIDNSLVEAFNTKYGTEYKVCPVAVLQKGSVSVEDGKYASSDFIEVTIPEDKYSELTKKGAYLVPIRLESTTQGTITSTKNRAYVIVNLDERLINESAGSGSINGTKVSDRSAWIATTTDVSVSASTLVQLFDGNVGTGPRFNDEVNPTVIVDMKEIKNVSALYFKNSSSNRNTYNFSKIGVQLSTDGITWVDAGSAAPVVESTINQYIILYDAISARYIKLSLQWTNGNSSTYRRFYEMDVYAR